MGLYIRWVGGEDPSARAWRRLVVAKINYPWQNWGPQGYCTTCGKEMNDLALWALGVGWLVGWLPSGFRSFMTLYRLRASFFTYGVPLEESTAPVEERAGRNRVPKHGDDSQERFV